MTDAELAIAAAAAGAEIVRSRFGLEITSFDKGHGDLTTDVDLAAEAAILDVIHKRCLLALELAVDEPSTLRHGFHDS